MRQLRQARSVDEFRRLAHAFHGGTPFAPGTTVYVIMSRQAPLYRVQTIQAERDRALRLADEPVDPALGWTAEEVAQREVYEVEVPPPSFENAVMMVSHPYWTESPCMAFDANYNRADRPGFDQIDRLEVVVRWRSGTETRFRAPMGTDAIFVTRGALEMFAYPMYAGTFGHQYVEELRARLMAQIQAPPGSSS